MEAYGELIVGKIVSGAVQGSSCAQEILPRPDILLLRQFIGIESMNHE